jgi:hypothetical protein
MPSKAEAEVIMRYCGIRKRIELSDTTPSETQPAARAAFTAGRPSQLAA